jgi:hypothetical protein
MEANQAAENLQVIRTLMERSAVYRRALAPIMTFCGVLGIAAGVLGWQLKLSNNRSFFFYWAATAAVATIGAFFLVRRQALKDAEPFWSPPTRRVAQALFLPFSLALFISIFLSNADGGGTEYFLIVVWLMLYGCALHSAGFFISRGFQILGWAFCVAGCAVFVWSANNQIAPPSLMMAALFGGLHLAAGIYLYFTEKRKNAA